MTAGQQTSKNPQSPAPARRDLRTEETESTRVLLMRFIALICGLERVCRLRAFRKSNRCLGDQLECWSDHSGLLRRRFELAIRDQHRRNAPRGETAHPDPANKARSR